MRDWGTVTSVAHIYASLQDNGLRLRPRCVLTGFSFFREAPLLQRFAHFCREDREESAYPIQEGFK
jgi:hypothetical protein